MGLCEVDSNLPSPFVVFSKIIVISPTVSSLTFSTSVSSFICTFRCFCVDLFSEGLCGVNSSSTFPSIVSSEIILLSPIVSSLTFSAIVSMSSSSFRCFCWDLLLMGLLNSSSKFSSIVLFRIIVLSLTDC